MSEAVEKIVKAMSDKLAASGGVNHKIKFVLDEGSSIFIDEQGVRVGSDTDADAEVTVSAREKTLVGIFDGSINPMMAFMSGKVRMDGDLGLAPLLKDLFM